MPDDADTHPLRAAGGAPSDGWVLGGRYRVLERVGSGGMAEVFRAHDELLDRDVAVKVFRTLLDDPDGSTNGPARRELELQAMAGLNHPNLITLYDGSVTGDGPSYLVLEYVDGPDLASRLKDGPLPEAEVRDIGAELADALAYVHAHGLVHRDVKPANILLGAGPGSGPGRSGGGRARLSDFGIVRMIGRPQMTSVEMTVGTAYYIAPEQAKGSSVGPEADVYALGLVLLEALTGTRAFDGPMHEALAARLATTPRVPADLPAPWPGLLTAMTAMDPAARPDAATVTHELRSAAPTGVLAGLAAPVAPMAAAAAAADVTPVPERRRRRFHPALLIVAAVCLVAAVALGAFLLSPEKTGAPAGPQETAPPSQQHSSPVHHHSTTAPVATVRQPSTSASASSTHKKKGGATKTPTTRPPAPGGGAHSSTSAPPSSSSAPVSSSSAAPSTPASQTSSTAAAVGGSVSSSSSPPGGG